MLARVVQRVLRGPWQAPAEGHRSPGRRLRGGDDMSHWIDEAYIEACREVDALFPGTPPIAPAAEAIMKTGMDAIEKQAERAETLRQRSDTLVRLGVTRVSEARDEWLYHGQVISGALLRRVGVL